MSFRREVWLSFWLQGSGAASVLLATLLLGKVLGPEVQGGFSRIKAEIEFVAAFTMFGLPQALFFYVKTGGLDRASALRWAGSSVALALPIGVGYVILKNASLGSWALASMGLAVAACVAHGQLRALLLVREPAAWFGIVTALPQVLVLCGVVAVVGAARSSVALAMATWCAIFAVAYGVAASVAFRRFRDGHAKGSAAKTVGWRELGHFGLAAWLTAVLPTAAVVVVQHRVEAAAGPAALGQFALALLLVQVPLTPISYAAPLLLRHWIEQPGAAASKRLARACFVGLMLLAACMWAVAQTWPDLGLGQAYTGTALALAVLLAGAAAESASRLLAVQASATGMPWVAVRAELARWAVLLLGWVLTTPSQVLSASALWAVAAAGAAGVFVFDARMPGVRVAGVR